MIFNKLLWADKHSSHACDGEDCTLNLDFSAFFEKMNLMERHLRKYILEDPNNQIVLPAGTMQTGNVCS